MNAPHCKINVQVSLNYILRGEWKRCESSRVTKGSGQCTLERSAICINAACNVYHLRAIDDTNGEHCNHA
jgi:hypothetical protein